MVAHDGRLALPLPLAPVEQLGLVRLAHVARELLGRAAAVGREAAEVVGRREEAQRDLKAEEGRGLVPAGAVQRHHHCCDDLARLHRGRGPRVAQRGALRRRRRLLLRCRIIHGRGLGHRHARGAAQPRGMARFGHAQAWRRQSERRARGQQPEQHQCGATHWTGRLRVRALWVATELPPQSIAIKRWVPRDWSHTCPYQPFSFEAGTPRARAPTTCRRVRRPPAQGAPMSNSGLCQKRDESSRGVIDDDR